MTENTNRASHSVLKEVLTFWRVVGFFVLALVFSHFSHAATYSKQITPALTYEWIAPSPGTAVALTDDSVSAAINLGFTFNYGTANYTQVRIGSNGWIFFGATSTAFTNAQVSNAAVPDATMLALWDDLNPGVGGNIRYQAYGAAPNRYFVITFTNVPLFSNNALLNTFQFVIYEDGAFRYNYQAVANQGNSATIGYKVSAADFIEQAFNANGAIPNSTSILWARPLLAHQKTVAIVSDPINGTTNPKFIADAIADYTVTVSNTRKGTVDVNTSTIVDPIDTRVRLFTGNLAGGAPYVFTNGTPSSGLTCPFVSLASTTDCIDFSSDAGATWTYVPTGGYDANVTHIRLRFTGTMAGQLAATAPNFTLRFRAQVK